MENIYCEKHQTKGRKGKFSYYCVECATEETRHKTGRGKK